MANANVIKSLQTKSSSGFSSPTYIGVEQFFVNPLRGSGVNNLEEQYVLGSNCVTTTWTENDGTLRITKGFYDATIAAPTNYYLLDIYQYVNGSSTAEYLGMMPLDGTGEEVLTFKLDTTKVEEVDESGVRLVLTAPTIFQFNSTTEHLMINPDDMIIERYELYWVRSEEDRTKVAEKLVYKAFEDDKEIIKEVIFNQLS